MRTDASLLPGIGLRDGAAELDVRLHYVTAGEGPLVVFLHGFPDFWYSWRHQLGPIAKAGFRVVAIDMRGYNLSAKPDGVASYGTAKVAKDVADLIESLGEEKAHVVGHDWGAGIAWAFAMGHAERLDKLAVLNGPHPLAMMSGMKDPVQLARSWYMFFFQLPWLPEEVAQLDDYKLLLSGFRLPEVKHGAITREDLEVYRASYTPESVKAMIGYYRAMFRPSLAPKLRPVNAPVLSIWGVNDPHLALGMATPPPEKVPHATTEFVQDASHWVHQEQPERVNQLLLSHL